MHLLLGVQFVCATSGCSVVGIRSTPEPPYKILRTDNDIEVRQYEPQLIAETFVSRSSDVDGDDGRKPPVTRAFRRLAGYIFGGNTQAKSIEMTAPVVQGSRSEEISMTAPVLLAPRDGDWWMAFTLPNGYTLDNAPTPNDARVKLRAVPAMRMATIRYSGRNSPEKMDRFEKTLRTWLATERITPSGAAQMAGYDPPWTLPFMRRNEIQIPINE